MKINWHFENVHVHIKIYINMKIILKNLFGQWYTMFYFITVIFVRKQKSYVKISFCKHEWNLEATTLLTTFYEEVLQFDNCNINIYLW